MNARDHALAVFKAGVAAVPVVGGPVASLIGDYMPASTERLAQEAIERLSVQLEELGDRVDAAGVNKEDFAELFKSCYLVMIRTHHERKRNAVINILTNILLRENDRERLDYMDLDHYVRCLDNLSTGAIEVLAQSLKIAKQKFRAKGAGP